MWDLRAGTASDRPLYGWSQFFGSRQNPSAIGTAYGLRLAMALDVQDSRLELPRIVSSLLSSERPGGGWSARSQRGESGHPEVTAWVLPPLIRVGLDAEQRSRLITRFEYMLEPDADVGLQSTVVLSSCLSALADIAPTSSRAVQLADALLDGARIAAGGSVDQVAWSSSLSKKGGDPSVPHTARAVVALHKFAAAAMPGKGSGYVESSLAGAAWLRNNADFDLFDEPIRRDMVGDKTDEVVVGHFTPAWLARALMITGDLGDLELLRKAVRLTLAHQVNGVWRVRRTSQEPIWMTYQGTAAIREYTLRNLPWPP